MHLRYERAYNTYLTVVICAPSEVVPGKAVGMMGEAGGWRVAKINEIA